MKNIFKNLIVLPLVLMLFSASAQQIPVINQYVFNPFIYNPARVGSGTFGQVYVGGKLQWTKMPFSPRTATTTFEMPFEKANMGFGATIFSDEAHLINNLGASVSYAYHIPFNKDKTHRLSLGLSAGAIRQRFDFSNQVLNDPIDFISTLKSSSAPVVDIAAGLNYQFKGLNVGVSVPQLIQSEANYRLNGSEGLYYQFSRHILANASYRIGNPSKITATPNVLFRYVQGIPMQFDAGVLLNWKELLKLGIGYRSANVFTQTAGLNASAGVSIGKMLDINYTIETLLGSSDRSAFGLSHEVGVCFRFGGGQKDKVKKLEEDVEDLQKKAVENDSKYKIQKDKLDSLNKKGMEHDDRLKNQEDAIDKTNQKVEDLDNRLKSQKNEMDAHFKDIEIIKSKQNSPDNTKLGKIYFKVDSDALDAKAMSQLDALAEVLKSKDNGYMVYIAGMASEEGSHEHNLSLSTHRAAVCRNYLERKGVKQLIMMLSYGEDGSDGTQSTEAERAENRRADIYLSGSKRGE